MKSGVHKPTPEELSLINEHYSKRELKEEELYVFDVFACDNDTVTAYFSRLGDDMIEAFNRDVNQRHTDEKGLLIGYLFGHDKDSIPSGTLFKSKLVIDKIDGKEVKRFKPSVFMLKNLNVGGINTDDYIRAYEAGHTEDCSVGFMASAFTCDICQNDIRDWMNCRHVPGQTYVMNEAEVKSGASPITKQCTYTVHQGFFKDHNLFELSGVYRGAMWGARIEPGSLKIGENNVAKVVDREDRPLMSTNIKDFAVGDTLKFNFQFNGSIEKIGSLTSEPKGADDLKKLTRNLSLSEKDKVELNTRIEKLNRENVELKSENKSLKATVDSYIKELKAQCRKLSVGIWGLSFDPILFEEEVKNFSIQQLRAKIANLEEMRARQIPTGRKTQTNAKVWGPDSRESQQENSDLYKIK